MRRLLPILFSAVLLHPTCIVAQESIRDYTRGFEKRDGYFPLYWDAEQGRLLLEIPSLGLEFLYMTSLATGFGNTNVSLDRGQIGGSAVAKFERAGPKIFLVLTNTRFRSGNTDNAALRRSVDESFPTSTVAAFDVVAQERGRILVDATKHFVADQFEIARRLDNAGQGTFALDRSRSGVHMPRTKGFPENTEIEVTLTFTSSEPGSLVRAHAPDGRALTLRQHHSLVKLPDNAYRPRKGHPRLGNFTISFYDFSRSLDERYQTAYIRRHRLQKRNPGAAMSEPVEPIIYYLDKGIPEPYRTAFRDGAMWWNRVLEAAGFIDAYRVEDMPDDMDPMDARYNVMQWVHRSDPGFSIGPSIIDPRTGEIIKAAVRMDSYRSLTDYNLYAGTNPDVAALAALEIEDWLGSLDPDVGAVAFTMARRRQHSAHEVGHTLGLAHNFAAASYGRASVMDYPAPLIQMVDGQIDLSAAYRNGPGAYDSIAVRYAYTEFPDGQEAAGLQAIVDEAIATGLEFVTDGDATSWGSYPEVHRWINGSDAVGELARVMDVRRALIERFDERVIRDGEPMVWLNYRFAPVYLHHRYALAAAVKAVGGMEYSYAVRGETSEPTRMLAPDRQRQALELVLDALEPEQIAIPERILGLMAPRAYGYGTDRWFFGSDAAPAFDHIGAARGLASAVIDQLLARQRAARLVTFHARDANAPALEEVVARLIDRTWADQGRDHPVLRRVVQRVIVDELIDLAADRQASVEARAGAEWGLRRISELIQSRRPSQPSAQAHETMAWADIERFLNRSIDPVDRSRVRVLPPGTPIGGGTQ